MYVRLLNLGRTLHLALTADRAQLFGALVSLVCTPEVLAWYANASKAKKGSMIEVVLE